MVGVQSEVAHDPESFGGATSAAPSPGSMTEWEAKALLTRHGISVPRGVLVTDTTGLAESVRDLSAPYVLKAHAPGLIHKSDVHGVKVGLESVDELAVAMAQMTIDVQAAGHRVAGFLVEELAPAGVEVVLGAVRNRGLGWSVMLGLGGIFVEILKDVSFGLAPLGRPDVSRMLGDLRGAALLDGVRGAEASDVESLIDTVVALAGEDGLLFDLPEEIAEIDLNPLIVSPVGTVAVDARFLSASSAEVESNPVATPLTDIDRLLEPRAVAILGASTRTRNVANAFIRNLQAYGFDGPIIPVHPTADRVEGLPAIHSLSDLTIDIDYAYVALPAGRVAGALATANQRVAFAQVVSSGFAEVDEGVALEAELVKTASEAGVRILGPNCLGTHSPWGNLTFLDRAPRALGSVSVVSQSGGLSVDIIRLGDRHGVGFRSVVSVGNCADVGPAELVEYLLADDKTEIIGLYLESLPAGRQVMDMLARHSAHKPVVLLAGGRTGDGSSAAASHTGALTSNHRLWPALARQSGMYLVDTLHEFVDVLAALQISDAHPDADSRDVLLFGNGGGTSVLAADAFSRMDLRISRLPEIAIKALEGLGLPPGNGLANPIDVPAGTLMVDDGAVAERILTVALEHSRYAVVVAHINVGVIASNTSEIERDVVEIIIDSIARARDGATAAPHVLLVLRSDGDEQTERRIQAYARRARDLGMPVLSELTEAALVARSLVTTESSNHQVHRETEFVS